MATISEMFIPQINKDNEPEKDSGAGWQVGAQLAALQQKRQNDAMQIQMQMKTLQDTRIKNLSEDIAKSQNYKDPQARKNYLEMMKGRRDAWGLRDAFPDEAMDSLKIDEDYGRYITLAREVNNPNSPYYGRPDLALKTFADPVKRAEIQDTPAEMWGDKPAESADLNKAFATYKEQMSKEKQAALSRNASKDKNDAIVERQLRGQRAALAREAQKANIPSLDTNLKRIDNVVNVDTWKPGDRLPGFEGVARNVDPKRLSGKALELRQAVETMQNELLKMQSGSAVTEPEMNRMRAQLGMAPVMGDGGVILGWTFKGFTNPEAVVNGIRAVKQKVGDMQANLAAGFPDVYDDYKAEYDRRSAAAHQPGDTINLNGRTFKKSDLPELKKRAKANKDQAMLDAIARAGG
jgi:hypothetical protein